MAGRKNHYVPQLLLRGFAVEGKKSPQIYVYERDKPPRLTGTQNYAAQRDFYINEIDTSVDDRITDYEGDVANYVHLLQSMNISPNEKKNETINLIIHLQKRNKFIREEMASLTDVMLRSIKAHFSKETGVKNFINSQQLFQEVFLQEIQNRKDIDINQKNIINAWLEINSKEILGDVSHDISDEIFYLIEDFSSRIKGIVKESHLKSLAKDDGDIDSYKQYIDLEYRLVHFSSAELILPDSITAVLIGGDKIVPFATKEDVISEIYLPLSSTVALHGFKRTAEYREIEKLNRILASCAFNSFISQKDLKSLRKLTKRIGKNAKIMERAAMARVVKDALPR